MVTITLNNIDKFILLIMNEDEYKPSVYFSSKIGVSTKTILSYVKSSRGKLRDYDCYIDSAPRKGLKLIGHNNNFEKLEEELQNSYKNEELYSTFSRRAYIIENLFFANNPENKITYSELSNNFFVSTSSIRTDFEFIEFYFSNFLRDDSTKDYSVMDEKSIQEGLKNIFQDNPQIFKKIFSQNVDREISDVVNKYLSIIRDKTIKEMNSYVSDSIKISISILLKRGIFGKHIEYDETLLINKIYWMQYYALTKEWSYSIDNKFLISEQDVNFICSLLLAHGVKIYSSSGEQTNKKSNIEIKEFISSISQLLDCNLRDDSRLFNSLVSHIEPMIIRIRAGINLKNPLKKEILKQYSSLCTLISYPLEKLQNSLNVSINADELSFIALHVQLALERNRKIRHYILVCPIGLGTSQLVFEKIKQIIPLGDVIEISDKKKLKKVDLEKIDIIISTTKLDDVVIPERTSVLEVSPLPTDSEIGKINLTIQNKIQHEINLLSESKIDDSSSILHYIRKDFIYLNQCFNNKEDVINFISNELQVNGFVKDSFKNSVNNRENMGATSIYTGVAIPHSDPDTVKKSIISIITLNSPITWGNNKVKLIFLLAIAKEDLNGVKSIVSSLYSTFVNKETIKKITSFKQKEEVIKQLESMRKQ